MTRKERKNIEQAKSNLKSIRNFLTVERNKAHGNEEKQETLNNYIDLVLLTIDLLKPEKN